MMKSENRPWTAKRKGALVLDVFKGKTNVSGVNHTMIHRPSRLKNGLRRPLG